MLIGNYSGGVAFYKGNNTVHVGLEETIKITELNIYPNPTKNSITIDSQKNEINNAKIKITDLLGKTLNNQKIVNQKTTINLNNFSQGIYLIQFSNDFGSKVFKVVKE